MFWWAKELLSSLRFLSARSNQPVFRSKRVYELFMPAAISCGLFFVYLIFPDVFPAKYLSDIAEKTFQFMVFVVPFHLAALGAFATFERRILDEPMKGADVEVRAWDNEDQKYFFKSLTLRQYVSLLFGYLCTLGIIFIVLYIFLSSTNLEMALMEGPKGLRDVAVLLVTFFIAHYACLSVYSITFLFEKVTGIPR